MSDTVMSHEVIEFCQQVLKRWRELALIRSCGSVLLAGSVLTAGLLAADALLDLPGWLRGFGLAAVILTVVAMTIRGCWRALRSVPLSRVAAIVEAADPAWQERLRAVVDDSATMSNGSPTARVCARQLQRELVPLIASHTPHDVLDGRQALTRLAFGMLAVVGLMAPWFWSSAGMQLLWQRFTNPQQSLAWGWSYRLEPVEPTRIAIRGGDVPIRVAAAPLFFPASQPLDLWLNWMPAGETTSIERRLTWSEADRAYVGHVTQPTASFAWTVVCRGGRSAPQTTQVVPAPALREFLLTADPPSYTGLPSHRFHNPVEPVALPQGTRLQWQLSWSEPLAGVDLQFRSTDRNGVATIVAQTSGMLNDQMSGTTAVWVADRSVQVAALVTTQLGLVVEVPLGEIGVTADLPPQFRLLDGLSRSVTATETVGVAAMVLDDHGLKSVELHLEPVTGDKQVRNLPLGQTPSTSFEGHQAVDLTEFGLEPGQMLKARWCATDNAPTPHVAWSDPVVVVIRHSSPEDQLHKIARESDAARDDLRKIRSELDAIRQQLRELHRRTAAATVKEKTAEESAELAQLTQREEQLRQRLQEWADERRQDDWLADSAKTARDIANGDLQEAQQLLAAAEQSEPRPRIEQMSKSLDELAAADRQLDRLDAQLAQLGQKGTPLQELAQLAERAEDLARELESPVEDHDANLNEQTEQLTQDLDNWLKQHPDFAAAVNAAQMEELRRVGQMAGQLAEDEQQVAEAIDPEFAGAVSADNPVNDSTPDESRAADAERPRNRPQPGSDDFQSGTQIAEQLREAAEQTTELARDLLDRFGPDAPPVEAAVAAAQSAQSAQEQLEQGQPEAAGQSARQAAEQAQQAGQSLEGSAAGKQAEQLGQSFQSAAEQLEARADSEEFQRGGLGSAQQRIADAAGQLEQLAQQTALLDGNKTSSEPQALGQQMSQALRTAEDALVESRDALANDNSGAAQAAALNAQAALEGAARLVPAAPKPSSVPTSTGESLQQARKNLQQAQQALQQPKNDQPSTAACESCRNAGNSLRRAAQAGKLPDPTATMPIAGKGNVGQPGGEQPRQGGLPESSPLEALNLELAKQSQRVWGRLPGKLRTEIFQGSQQAVHPEYAKQIQRYFERIAQSSSDGATPQSTTSP